MVFKATEGTMRQDTSRSSRQAVVIGNRPDPFVDTAFVTDSTWPRRGMPAAIYRHNPTASWLNAPGNGIAAPEDGNISVDLVGAWEHWQRRACWPLENARRWSSWNRNVNGLAPDRAEYGVDDEALSGVGIEMKR